MICHNSLEVPKGAGIYGFFFSNGKKYIGKANKIRARYIKYKSNLKTGKYYRHNFCVILKREGFENVEFRAIELCHGMTNNEILKREASWIKYYDSSNPEWGYNICKYSNDATGIKQSEEHRLKNSGKNSVHYGKPMKPHVKNALILANTGRKHTEEHKRKLVEVRKTKEFHDKRSKISKEALNRPEVKAKTIQARAKQDMSFKWKAVKQIDIQTGNLINIFKSLSQACLSMGKSIKFGNCISRVCRKEKWYKSTLGFKWEWATRDEYNNYLKFPLNSEKISKYQPIIKITFTKRKINQVDKNSGNIIKTWDSLKEAAITLFNNHTKTSGISAACTGKIPHSYGFRWQYA